MEGEVAGRVISTIETRPPSNRISRTRSPTVTASSTIAVRMCGGDTAASTPHCSLKSHSFFGWFTRASTRGTANSCFARSDVPRLSAWLPVAAAFDGNPEPEQVAAAEALADLLPVVEEHQLDLLDAPRRGGHRGDVQALVDLGATRVVDPGDHFLHVVVLEGDARRNDVGV